MGKERLDKIVVARGLAESREKAQALIMAGEVCVDGQVHLKPGTSFAPADIEVTVKSDPLPYVSRGGLKLEKALAVFAVDVTGKDCLDVGASTGGFTDCLLQHGACRVIAVDVGYGQLAWSLRSDPRVVVLEKTNIRYLQLEGLPFRPQLITVDTSFISVTKFLEVLVDFLPETGEIICLVKPQFEAGPAQVGKGGIVRDPQVLKSVLQEHLLFGTNLGLGCSGLTFSPIKGTKGNIEFLAYWQKGLAGIPASEWEEMIESVVTTAQLGL